MPAGDAMHCRLCGGGLTHRFDGMVLGRHAIAYYACDVCGSLQTETPYWLGEAYANNLADRDTGAAQRCFVNLGAVAAVARLSGARDILDIGGGDGLTCRLLRDHELNAYVADPHATPIYAQGFTRPDFARPQLVTAFEVVEHFAAPERELAQIFDLGADMVLISTLRWNGQGPDWWYLAPATGQHVFFYSDKALALIADRYGYALVANGNFPLFCRPGTFGPVKRALVRLLLLSRMPRLISSLLMMRQATGSETDVAILARRAKSGDQDSQAE